MLLPRIFWVATSCVALSGTDKNFNICVGSDGKKQPLVFDTYEKKVVYPVSKCGVDSEGERFEGRNLKFVCLGGSVEEGEDGVVGCSRVNSATVERLPEEDEKGCRAFRTGFSIPVSNNETFFHTVFSVCWNEDNKYPVWVKNKINLSVVSKDSEDLVDAGIRTKFRFSPLIFGKNYNPKTYFSIAYQKQNILKFQNHGDFYARGHLAPAADFFLASERWATFSLENVIPQWQTHNNGKWKEIEDTARNINGAYIAKTGPVFYHGKRVQYLDQENNFLPVPHAIFKSVYNREKQLLFHKCSDVVPACENYEEKKHCTLNKTYSH
uniref:Wsv191-like protein n=1 Tax=Pasiphaea japonica whispovirus TaxID=2984286 RepID=A0A9C7F8L7_9VIRU|nr:MAG: wsv191-like protein [Pasiphaea japonica whispovirus]